MNQNQGSAKVDGSARNVGFAFLNGSGKLAPIPMNSDGSIRIEIIPTSSTGTGIATRHRLDENSRWTSFGLESTNPNYQLPITMINLQGTPAIRIDMNVL
jgi:hypothetical protein